MNFETLLKWLFKWSPFKIVSVGFLMYYGIFYELWTFADFDRLCKLEKRRLSQSQPNFADDP